MFIRHKGLEHGNTTDAPFVGARINSIRCSQHCTGCFNQHLRELEIQRNTTKVLIQEIKARKINQGIIFGGLEWTEQPEELIALVEEALEQDLLVMIYTSTERPLFERLFPHLVRKAIWVKFGHYDSTKTSYYDERNDVILAGDNQRIVYFG